MESGPGVGLLTVMVETFAAQGIRTVFEGIEEGWQLELAEKSGASMVQGYVLARPEIAPTSWAVSRQAVSAVAMAHVPQPAEVAGCGIAHAAFAARSAKPFGRRVRP
jgi:EAL domain-containing protein (putative c-di-GMP-specific phosphodiesterase class I)